MGFCSIARVHIHRDLVKLLETRHCVEQHHHDTTSFDSLHGSAKHVGRETLKVLENAHSKCLTENLMRVLVEAILDLLGGQEELNLIDFRLVEIALGFQLFDLLHPFLLMTRKL